MCRSGAPCGCGGSGRSSAIPAALMAGAVLASSAAAAEFLTDLVVVVVIVLVVACAAGSAWIRYVIRRDRDVIRLPAAPRRAEVTARPMRELPAARQAIEAPRLAIPVITDLPPRDIARGQRLRGRAGQKPGPGAPQEHEGR